MPTLYLSDLDGTLLNGKAALSDTTVRIINELIEGGASFAYATARSFSSAGEITKRLNLKLPCILYNGTFIAEPQTGRVLSGVKFTSAQIARIQSVLKQYEIYPLAYSHIDNIERASWLLGSESEGIAQYVKTRRGSGRLRGVTDISRLDDGDVFHYTCIDTKERLMPVYDILSRDSELVCYIYKELYNEEYWFEVAPAIANKAIAAKELCRMCGFDKLVVFGDAVNDMQMFAAADECYATANAVDELKAIATAVIDDNDSDGVARFLQRHVK